LSVQEESTDFYMSKELNIKLAGFSSLPTVKKVIEKLVGGKKLTPSEKILVPHITAYDSFVDSDEYKKAADKNSVLLTWIKKNADDAVKLRREQLRQMSEIKFSIVLGQIWPKEFASLEENTMTIKLDDDERAFTMLLEEKEVKI
jgi:hypothetical protein